MILQNDDYVKRGLDEAVMQNNLLLFHDKGQWFYKKWPGLTAPDVVIDSMEDRVSNHLKKIKDSYREDYERGYISYPTSISFANYKENRYAFHDDIMKIFSKMPKCGLLHVHSAAALSVEGLMELLQDWKGQKIYIVTRGPQTGKLTYHAPAEGEPGEAEELQLFLQSDNRKETLIKWLTVGRHTDGALYIWDEFNKVFMRTSELFTNRDFYVEYHRRFFLECLQDRIDYVELRCGFEEFTLEENGVQHDEILNQTPDFLDALMEAKTAAVATYNNNRTGEGRWELPYNDLGLGVILCARRDLDADKEQDRIKLMKKIDTAIAWKLGPYRDLIKGFDFVSEEDRGRASYSYYRDIFYGEAMSGYPGGSDEAGAFDQIREQHHLDGKLRAELIELMLHAGESLWIEQENIIDAKIACRSRMGHGFQLLEYPGALMSYQAGAYDVSLKAPVLEVCPISNQMLRYFPDIRNHYALILMKMGVPCVLANDDPQILGNPGLSYDFWEMYMASDGGLLMVEGLVFTAFIFQYQHRHNKSLDSWTDMDYNNCLNEFKVKYWRPFITEISDSIH